MSQTVFHDNIFFKSQHLLDTQVNMMGNFTTFLNEVKPKLNGLLDGNKVVRLRQKINENLGQVFDQKVPIAQHNIFENMEIALQFTDIPNPENSSDYLLVMVKVFDPATWHLSEPKEMWVSKKANIGDLAKSLADATGMDENCVEVTKIASPSQFHRVNLMSHEWLQNEWFHLKHNEKDKIDISRNYIASSPFYLNTDGLFLVVKHFETQIREMTKDEKVKYQAEFWDQNMDNLKIVKKGDKNDRNAEQQLKITVVQKQTEQEKTDADGDVEMKEQA